MNEEALDRWATPAIAVTSGPAGTERRLWQLGRWSDGWAWLEVGEPREAYTMRCRVALSPEQQVELARILLGE